MSELAIKARGAKGLHFIGVAIALLAACGASSNEPANAAPVGTTARDEWSRDARTEAPAAEPAASASASAAEAAGGQPPTETEPAAAGGGGAAPSAAALPPNVEVGEVSFENGEVPKAQAFVTASAPKIASCVGDNGGLSGDSGQIKLQFLVRARGRAEGVDVLSSKGVSDAALACITEWLKNRAVGTPSADPVGVSVTIDLKAKK